MRHVTMAFALMMALPIPATAGGAAAGFVDARKSGSDHVFLYRCKEMGNMFEVENHYNPEVKREEIRFIVNGLVQEWITGGINPAIFHAASQQACRESTSFQVSGYTP